MADVMEESVREALKEVEGMPRSYQLLYIALYGSGASDPHWLAQRMMKRIYRNVEDSGLEEDLRIDLGRLISDGLRYEKEIKGKLG